MQFFVYILKCSDDTYYTGSYRGDDLQHRVNDHNNGLRKDAYTFRRRPVELVWNDVFDNPYDMIDCERRIKGWSRKKKEALIRGDEEALPDLSRRRSQVFHDGKKPK